MDFHIMFALWPLLLIKAEIWILLGIVNLWILLEIANLLWVLKGIKILILVAFIWNCNYSWPQFVSSCKRTIHCNVSTDRWLISKWKKKKKVSV